MAKQPVKNNPVKQPEKVDKMAGKYPAKKQPGKSNKGKKK
jgi:hypothetical protein